MKVPNYYGNDLPEYQWISGNLQTAKRSGEVLRGWRDGYFEARMWFPAHPLSFPAFWLLNAHSILKPETSIEIDIVEHKGFEHELYGAYLHEWGGPDEHHESTGVPTPVNITRGYYRYGVLVDRESCVPFFERKQLLDLNTGKPARWKIHRSALMDERNDVFWALLTLAMRSDVPFPRPLRLEDRHTFMLVDYMRVYR